jgi:hypothetical protein
MKFNDQPEPVRKSWTRYPWPEVAADGRQAVLVRGEDFRDRVQAHNVCRVARLWAEKNGYRCVAGVDGPNRVLVQFFKDEAAQ